jgi:hypothetical protein
MISRDSDAYQQVGKLVHPEHTELSIMSSQKSKKTNNQRARMLPEYIEHYWLDAQPTTATSDDTEDEFDDDHKAEIGKRGDGLRGNYLGIVTKDHGMLKSKWSRLAAPNADKYHDVAWIYYFQQTA